MSSQLSLMPEKLIGARKKHSGRKQSPQVQARSCSMRPDSLGNLVAKIKEVSAEHVQVSVF